MYIKRKTSWAINIISLVLFLMVFNMVVAPVSVDAGVGDLTVALTSPAAELTSSGETQVVYQVNDLADYENVSFVWNFSNGLDTYLQANKEEVTLKAAGGDDIVINYDQELVYTEQNEPVKLRQLELTMVDSGKLQPDTEYIVELGPDIMSNNGSTLGKTYTWYFTTASSAGEEESPGDSGPVSWPAESQITASSITPGSLTLTWTAAENAAQYKIYQDSNEIQTLVGSELSYNVTGLTAKTPYEFKVEAGDADGVWTSDGPVTTATTAGQLTISSYSPASTEAVDASKVEYQVSSQLEPDGIHFVWDFSNGMDEKLVSNLDKITLKKSDGTVVDIDRGTLTQEEITGDIIELGDFKYTKQTTPTKLRRLEFILSSCTLESDTTYKLKLASDIEANNGDKLWLNHVWTFTTSSDTVDPPAESGPVSWPDGSQITAADITPGTLTLTWTAADNAANYKVYQDGNEIQTLAGSELSYNVTGLTAKTPYEFKVEAGDASDAWTDNGPVTTATTAGQLTISSYSPASTEAVDASKVEYQVSSQLEPDGIHFVWDFSNGMDEKLVSNLDKITLKKSDGTVVDIDRGTLTQEEITGDIIELGDFKYTKQTTPTKLRRLEFILSSCTLESDTTYKLKLANDIEANNGDKLWLNHLWTFTTSSPPTEGDENDNSGDPEPNTGGGMTVEFAAVSLYADQTVLHLDFSKGIDENMDSNLEQIEIYERSSGKSVSYSSEYKKEGQTATGDKIRQLILTLDDLKPSTTYIVELGQDITANNGSTLGEEYEFKFTTKSEGSYTSTDTENEPVTVETEDVASPATSPVTNPLNDINGHWAGESIQALVDRGVVSGYPDGSFKPDQTITRAEFVTMLVKAFALESRDGNIFADTSSHWARQAISTAAGYGIVNGYDSSTFGPNDLITREQIAVMLMKAAKLADAAGGNSFNDSRKISPWAVNAVNACFANGIILGYEDNTFGPQNNATRAEALIMISRALQISE